jgi:phenylpropionate dioxygenase-like ring-hydroxylating dioxygenase large terminal subunit
MEADVMNQQRPALPAASNASIVRGLPAWTYFNAELTALEYETLIRPSWQFVCHVNQLKTPGAFATLDMMRDSVIVMRGKDGVIRAFANACRHRGSRLLDGAGTCRGRITCPYHGWSYGLDGRLAAVPSEKTFRGIDKAELGLQPVGLEILLGLVFVRVCGEGPSLAEMWGDFVEVARPYRLEEMELVDEPWIGTWQCNWKVAVDNNLENYHVPIGHPGYHRLLDSDLVGEINAHGVAYSKSVLREKPSTHWTERMYQKLAPEVLAHLAEEVRKTWLFCSMVPNMGIDIYPDSMDVFQILPNTAESCTMRYPIYVRPDERREMKVLRYLNARINAQVGLEDQQLSERVQMGMRNFGFEPGPLSDYEHAIKDFHDRIRAACPVTTLPAAPAEGTLRARNAAMLAG